MAVWPAFTLLLAAVAGVILLAARSPAFALVAALALFGAEGSLKVLLIDGETPLPFSSQRIAAALLDLALAAAIVGLLRAGASDLRAAWHRFDPLLRAAAWLMAAWLLLSALQIFQSGDVGTGLAGFRLTQFYVVAVIGGLLLFYGLARRADVLRALVVTIAAVAGYAAFRTIVGPANLERIYALSRGGVTEFQFGEVFRTVGSFSGAVGLASFLAPAAVFVFVLGLLLPRYRGIGFFASACALIAIAGSQVRAALLAVGIGLLVATVVALAGRLGARQKKVLVIAFIGAFAAGSTAAVVAGSVSAETRDRANVFVHPLSDRSVELRLDTWRASVEDVLDEPQGTGLGTVGASTAGSAPAVTTDNSYLKVFREQGLLGGALFSLAVLVACVAIGRRLLRAGADRRPVGIAALGGFVAFLVIAGAGEYVEQPGKVLAWTLLGVALGESLPTSDEPPPIPSAPRSADPEVVWLALALFFAAVAIGVSSTRAGGYKASVDVFALRGANVPVGGTAEYVRTLLGSDMVTSNIVEASGFLVDPHSIADRVTLATSGSRTRITARAETPRRARDLAYALGVLGAEAAHGKLVVSQRPDLPRLTRWTDRAVDLLPGEFPRRAHPVLAAGAGFALAMLLYGLLELWSLGAAERRAGP